MIKVKDFSLKTCFLLATALLAVSCSKQVEYDPNAGGGSGQNVPTEEPNTFDFSTTQMVRLTIDYSADNLYSAVFFSVYSENPFNVEVAEDGYETKTLKEDISPIYENVTDHNGKFSRTIELPSYAKHLYVLTGDFTVSQPLMEADVVNGTASFVVTATTASAPGITRGSSTGVSTNDITPLWNLSFIDDKWTKGDRIYNDWLTPLGTWNSDSGRPDYVNNVDDKLKFTEEEFVSVYAAATTALNANRQCSDEMITQADLELVKDSEVGITMLGGNTCWHSTLGYYYYTDEAPTRENLQIIMLFPNTQDGHWTNGKGANNNYNGNIGVERGDVVQLMYYPNIASGSFEGGTAIFPKGTKIGFILKTNGWGMQKNVGNKKYYVDVNYGNRKYNNWGASTDNLSYFAKTNENVYKYYNYDFDSRTAKFQCTTANNHKYAIVSFEDAFDDKNYSDVVFALKPMDAFQKLPDPEDRVIETKGIYCFEDLWPSKGDYDLNDAVIDFKHTKTLRKAFDENEFKMIKETISLTTYQNYVELKSGLAMTLDTPVTPSKVVMKKVKDGNTEEVSFTKDDNVYIITDNIKGEIGTEYVVELYYDNGISDEYAATAKPFIYRNVSNGKRLEVHIVGEAPTSKMDTSYFGTEDDKSDPAKGRYYVRSGNYPFAFFLNNATVKDVQRILQIENEHMSIDQLYSGYLGWATSGGVQNTDWYKH